MRKVLAFTMVMVVATLFSVAKKDEPVSVAVSEDGRYLAVGTSDGHVWVWDVEKPSLLKIFEVSSMILSMDFAQGGNVLIVGENDGTFDVLNVETGGIVQSVKVNNTPVIEVRALKGGRYVAVVRKNGAVEIWDSNGWWRFMMLNTGFEDPVDVEITSSHVVMARDDVIKVWSFINSKLVNTISIGVHIEDIDVVLGGRNIVVTGLDASGAVKVIVLDTLTGSKVADLSSLPNLRKGLKALKMFPDSTVLVGFGKDGIVRLWDLTSMELTDEFHVGHVDSLAFTEDGMIMATVGSDWRANLWKMKGTWIPKTIRRFPGDIKDIDVISNDVVVSGYKLLAILSTDGDTVKDIRQSDDINAVSIDEKSWMIITGSKKGYVKVWNGRTGELLKVLWQHDFPVLDVSMRGNVGYSLSEDGELLVWDVVKGDKVGRFFLGDGITTARFSPDGRFIAVGYIDGSVALYTVDGREVWKRVKAHDDSVSSISIDENYIVSGDALGNVRVWNRETGDLALILRGKLNRVSSIAIDEAQNSIVCADTKGNIEVWYMKGKLMDSFKMKGAVLDIEPLGDGDYIAGGWLGRLLIWHKTHSIAEVIMIPGGDYLLESPKFGCVMSENFVERAESFYRLDPDELKNCAVQHR